MSFTAINLPWPILIHSIGLSLLGLTVTFGGRKPSSSKSRSSLELRGPTSLLGITTATIGLAYLGSSYMPIEQNQFLHASVPVRLGIAVLLIAAGLLNKDSMDERGWWTHVGFAVWDGVGALWLGWYLGRWDGRCPGVM